MRKLIFLSYPRKQLEFTDRLATDLREIGYGVWYDPSLRAGENWAEIIQERIAEANYVLVIVDKSAKRSDWISNEIAMAAALKKPIIPIVVEVLKSEDLPFLLKELNYLDFAASDYASSFAKLCEDLEPVIIEEELLYQHLDTYDKTGGLIDEATLKVIEKKIDKMTPEPEAVSLIKESRKKHRSRKIIITALGVVALFLFICSWLLAFSFQNEAQSNERLAATSEAIGLQAIAERGRAEELATELFASVLASRSLEEGNYDLALLLGAEALSISDNSNTRQALFELLDEKPQLISFLGHDLVKPEVSISPDGKLIAITHCIQVQSTGSCLSSGLDIIDTEENQVEYEIPFRSGYIGAPVFSPDSTELAVLYGDSGEFGILIWQLLEENLLEEVVSLNYNANEIAFSPSGRILAAAGFDNEIHLWETNSYTEIARLSGHSDYVLSLAFSPEGNLLATSSRNGEIILWDTNDLVRAEQPLSNHSADFNTILGIGDNIIRVAFAPNGLVLASIGSDKLSLWNVETGDLLSSIQVKLGRNNVWFNGEDQIVTTQGNEIVVYDADLNVKISGLFVGSSANSTILSASYNQAEDLLVTSQYDGELALWDLDRNSRFENVSINGHNSWILTTAISNDSEMLATGSLNGELSLWKIKTMEAVNLGDLAGPYESNVQSIVFDSTGSLIAIATGNEIIMGDLENETVVWRNDIPGENNKIELVFDPSDETIIAAISASRSGDLSAPTQILFLDRNLGIPTRSSLSESSAIWRLAISPDGRWLVTGSHNAFAANTGITGIALWDLSAQEPSKTYLPGEEPIASSLAYSPSGDQIVSAGLSGINIWDLNSRKLIHSTSSDDNLSIPGNARFTPDGNFLVTTECNPLETIDGCQDSKIAIRTVDDLKIVGEYYVEGVGAIPDFEITPDGTYIVAGSQDGSVLVLSLELQLWKEIACSIANRSLADEEIGSDLDSILNLPMPCEPQEFTRPDFSRIQTGP